MTERDIRIRLDSLIDRWLKASPTERMSLVSEKIRLEEMLERLRGEGGHK